MDSPRVDETFREVMMMESPPPATPAGAASRNFVFGELWQRPGLSRRDRRWVTLTSVAAGGTPAPLDAHVYAALASGDIEIEPMLEFVLHFAVYCGWPKASQLETAVSRQWVRIQEERGEAAAPWPPVSSTTLGPNDPEERIEIGAQVFADIELTPAPPPDTPYKQVGILSFAFGQVWPRPGLSRRERRIITVTCVGLSGALVPLRSHVTSALHSGDLNEEEIDELVLHFSVYNGFSMGANLGSAVAAVLAER
jgi:4-carboxymuconolactone decarboxylase